MYDEFIVCRLWRIDLSCFFAQAPPLATHAMHGVLDRGWHHQEETLPLRLTVLSPLPYLCRRRPRTDQAALRAPGQVRVLNYGAGAEQAPEPRWPTGRHASSRVLGPRVCTRRAGARARGPTPTCDATCLHHADAARSICMPQGDPMGNGWDVPPDGTPTCVTACTCMPSTGSTAYHRHSPSHMISHGRYRSRRAAPASWGGACCARWPVRCLCCIRTVCFAVHARPVAPLKLDGAPWVPCSTVSRR